MRGGWGGQGWSGLGGWRRKSRRQETPVIPKPRKPTSATTATAVRSMEASRRKDEEAARRMAVMRPKMILMTVNGGLGTLADWASRGWTGVPGCACFSMTRRAGLACGPFGGDALRGCPTFPPFVAQSLQTIGHRLGPCSVNAGFRSCTAPRLRWMSSFQCNESLGVRASSGRSVGR